MHLVLLGMRNRTLGPFLAAIRRILISVVSHGVLAFPGRIWLAIMRCCDSLPLPSRALVVLPFHLCCRPGLCRQTRPLQALSLVMRFGISMRLCREAHLWHLFCALPADLVSGNVVERLSYHQGAIRDCSWHPFEPMLATASFDCR
jgi:hypothetical protein